MATSMFHLNFPGAAKIQEEADSAAFIIGCDLHDKTTAICIIDPKHIETPVLQRARLQNNELIATLQRFPGKKIVACEAAFGWRLLGTALQNLPDVTFVPLDARKTSAWIKTSGVKNDRIDAQVLCMACLHGGIGRLIVYRQDQHTMECNALVGHRDNLVRQGTRLKHRLTALGREVGPNPYTGEIPDVSSITTLRHTQLTAELADLQVRIDVVEAQMKSESTGDAIIPILDSIPGIGAVTSFALRWKIGNIDRFKNSEHLASYFGFSVRSRQSGETTIPGRITKTGSALHRRLLIQGAQIVRSKRPDLLSLYFPAFATAERMKDRRHVNKVVVALARKNLLLAYTLWTKQVPFDLAWYQKRRQETAPENSLEVPGRYAVAHLSSDTPLSCVTSIGG
jgi:transposase